MKVYVLKSCDSCRKALAWLNDHGVSYEAHDVRTDGLDQQILGRLADTVDWSLLVNKSSTTWRGLAPELKEELDRSKALSLIEANPTLMKRPVFDIGHGKVFVGFGESSRKSILDHFA